MPRYRVELPVTGRVTVEVEAADEKSAVLEALQGGDLPGEPDEWEVHEHAIRGGVFYGQCACATAEQID